MLTSIRLNARILPLAALVLLAPHPATADCLSVCLSDHGCDMESDEGKVADDTKCASHQNECEAQCRDSSGFGAIAYDKKTSAWGLSDEQDDERGAAENARAACAERGGANCEIVETMHNDCAAVAEGNNVVTWARKPTVDEAQGEALAACQKSPGTSCVVQISNCYFP